MLEQSTDIKGPSVEETYKQLSLEEQILLRPDTYIGSVEPVDANMWVVDDPADLAGIKIRRRAVRYVPGFIKLFDEVLTNASDHKQRPGTGVKTIRVNVTPGFTFSVWNDGTGIPVQMHADAGCYVPELIFGRLLTGSNYDDSQERFGGGRNGFGAKLANRFSTEFRVQTYDGNSSYDQLFTDNMMTAHAPLITKHKGGGQYTNVQYTPDFARLPIAGMEDDTMRIIVKRVLDIAAYNPDLKVYFNDQLLPVSSLKDYAAMHLEPGAEMFYEKLNDRFDVVFAESPSDGFEQVSVVNGISTHRGGAHVDVVANQMVNALREALTKGNKKLNIRPSDIRSKLFMFLTAKVSNPQFDTQTKEFLVTKMTEPVLKGAQVSEKLVKQVMKSDIVASILDYIALREQAELSKINKTKGGTRVKIAKLQDAYKAGTKEGDKCALFLTEGDSAASGCISGLSVVGRDHYGVFPLKGKPLNVRDAAVAKIKENDEINNIMTALGLVIGRKYTDVSELRYGKLVIMSDADNDGTHIKGLLINLFHTFWPELLQMRFMYEFVTPILKARKNKEVLSFYNFDQYKEWKDKGPTGYKVKYYKGLGTITSDEMKELFREVDKHLIPFSWSDDGGQLIDKLFNKKRADDRKDWLLNYQGELIPDKFGKPNRLDDFFNLEFIQFSMADNVRSIPQMMDGLKPSQRKILYTAFRRNLKEELKVAQLAGAVAETSAYHHGELSLIQGIVGMAQDFVGSNNVNLLYPSGMFGTRLQGGSDAASGRYIFTYLAPLTRLIFRPEDDAILNYLEDDGESIEPDYYLPIIPMALVNGAEGIGTGWSTAIPKHDPKAVIKAIERKLAGKRPEQLRPFYRGFAGTVDFEGDRWVSNGVVAAGPKSTAHITELPVYVWTEKYVEHLERLADTKVIKGYKNNSTDKKVDITLVLEKDAGLTPALVEKLKLKTALNTTNMHLFKGINIVKYANAEQILDDFYAERIVHYGRRKESMLQTLKTQYQRAANIYKFIVQIIQGKLSVMRRPEADIVADLDAGQYTRLEGGYDYLLNLPTRSLTSERMQAAKEQMERRKEEYQALQAKSPEALWQADLDELKAALAKQPK
jgi:DNA topoisomerase-2